MAIELELKPDFAEAVERLEAWWHGEVIDRACVQLMIPRPGDFPPLPEKEHATLRERWMDVEYNVERAAATLERRLYIGEAFPSYMPNLGPDICTTLVGGELHFRPTTSYVERFVEDWREVDLTPNFENVYWRTIREMTALSLEMGKGKFLTGITDLHTNADLLAGIRGSERLCLDLVDRPDDVHDAMARTRTLFMQAYDDLYDRIRPYGFGSTT